MGNKTIYHLSLQKQPQKGVPRKFAKFTGKHLRQSLSLKRDSGAGVFL